MKKIALILLCNIFSNVIFSQEKECLNVNDVTINYNSSKYCEDFSNYGGTKIFYDVYKVIVSLNNETTETIYYNYAGFKINGVKGGCSTNFADYSGTRGFPAGEKIQRTLYVYIEKDGILPEPQCELKLVPKGEQPQVPYTEFASSCINIPPCEKKDFSEKEKSTFTDSRDGKTYKTVKIGNQTWFAENLNYNAGSGSWCYDNSSSNCTNYSRLYTWAAAKTACPTGWHLPSDAEWTTLTTYLGGADIAGGKLKSTSTWKSPNTGATNSSGFTALPGGYRNTGGTFYNVGNYGTWWSATESGTDAWSRALFYNYAQVNRPTNTKGYGFSCRCVKD